MGHKDAAVLKSGRIFGKKDGASITSGFTFDMDGDNRKTDKNEAYQFTMLKHSPRQGKKLDEI